MFLRLILALAVTGLLLAGCTAHRSAQHGVAKTRAGAGYEHSNNVRIRGQYPVQVASAVQQAYDPGRASAYILGSGDKVRITVFGQENLSRTYPVDAGGFVSMPLIGAIRAGGMTTFDLESQITEALRKKYVKDPKVTVEVETYRPFFILGEVRKGGQYPYVAGMTVETAVAIAGGYTARAKKRSVQLSRPVNGRTVVRTVPPSWKIRPGDTITVKERFL